ncbi:hypothetical protein T12_12227 [Trichinella patagoniensis]|uniref:Uncharacterized protein n=1 Tax=Trichinella patagoniensis TaxID=990121 RepID=A0A0V0Z5K6_9BILA|nr:hypothetical protein T12_12227 [Trichinella patagoniensis]
MTTTGKVRLVALTSLARASREEAWHSRLMWPSPPHFQHSLSPLLSGSRRGRGGGLFVPARVLSVRTSFICRNTSAKSSSTSLCVVTAVAAASVTLPAVGSKSSNTVLTEATLASSVVSSLTTRSSLTATSTASAKLSISLRRTAVLTASVDSPSLNCCNSILSADSLISGNAFAKSLRK